jgi:hypothetical protein
MEKQEFGDEAVCHVRGIRTAMLRASLRHYQIPHAAQNHAIMWTLSSKTCRPVLSDEVAARAYGRTAALDGRRSNQAAACCPSAESHSGHRPWPQAGLLPHQNSRRQYGSRPRRRWLVRALGRPQGGASARACTRRCVHHSWGD